jgi:HSP20 family protein
MTKKDENDDENDEEDDDDEEEGGDPLNFFKSLGDPNKIFKNIDPSNMLNSKEFQHIFKEIFKQIANNLPKELQGLSPEDIMREFMKNRDKFGFKGPIMYGFNINFGQDGKPTIDSFGNIKKTPYSDKPKVKEVREPLVEVNEDGKKIIIIAEMPGVTREDIELKATSNSITISTKEGPMSRKYYKEVDLPSTIDSNYAKARYTNGILEVTLKKIDEKHTSIKID